MFPKPPFWVLHSATITPSSPPASEPIIPVCCSTALSKLCRTDDHMLLEVTHKRNVVNLFSICCVVNLVRWPMGACGPHRGTTSLERTAEQYFCFPSNTNCYHRSTELNLLFFPTGSPNLGFSPLGSRNKMGVDRRDHWTCLWLLVDGKL